MKDFNLQILETLREKIEQHPSWPFHKILFEYQLCDAIDVEKLNEHSNITLNKLKQCR